MVRIAGVRFKKACKVYDFEAGALELGPGDTVIVEVERGLGMGTVVYSPKDVDPDALTRQLKKIVRKADAVDIERQGFNTERESEAFRICREKIVKFTLPMKLIRVEYLFDSSKAIFYFTSDTRVDFRELVKDLAATFHTRIEMRQIGVRDEAKMIGGLGPCGRELCCSGFLADFEPVTIRMAKEQNLALNPVKISGICGRLMCCLSYEHEMYQGERKKERERGEKAPSGGGGGGERPPRDRKRPGPGKAAAQQGEPGCGGCGKHEHGKHEQGRPEQGRREQGRREHRRRDQGRPEQHGKPEQQGKPEQDKPEQDKQLKKKDAGQGAQGNA